MRFQLFGRAVAGLVICTMAAANAQQENFPEAGSGKIFPTQVTFSFEGKDYTLLATGAAQAKREKKTGDAVATHTIAHYMEAAKPDSAESIFEIILQRPIAKQVIIDFDRASSLEKIQKGYKLFFSKVIAPTELAEMKAAVEEFTGAFTKDVEAGQRMMIRWLPDGRLVVIMPEAPEKIVSASALGALLWKSWFGESTRVDRFSLVERFPK